MKVEKDRMTKQVEKSTGVVTPPPVGPGTTPPVKVVPMSGFYGKLFGHTKQKEK